MSDHQQRDEDFETAESELLEAGNAIRRLKSEAAAAGGEQQTAAEQEEYTRLIQERVDALNELKERYCSVILAEINRLEQEEKLRPSESCVNDDDDNDHKERIARLEQFLPSATAKQRKSERRKKNKQQTAKNEKKFDPTAGTEGIKCQRKIHSLLHHTGNGDTFRYFPSLNKQADADGDCFCEGEAVYLTEKMDGTTMQATNQGVFKRFERRKTASRKKNNWHSMSEEERYRVERVDLSNRSNKFIAQAVQDYLPTFEKIPDGVCIYFEAIGRSIGARFAEVKEFSDTIFVFDSTQDGEFVPFGVTMELCKSLGLPCVAHSTSTLSLSSIIETLSSSPRYTALPSAQLEGFVVRSTKASAAAKIRVDDIPKICYEEDE